MLTRIKLEPDMNITTPTRRPLAASINLYSGGKLCTLEELRSVVLPEATKTWYPLPHHEIVENARRALSSKSLEIIDEAHALDHDGDRYFGLMSLRQKSGRDSHQDYQWIVGLRNSHDRSCSAGLAFGSQVFVCSNMSFTGDIKIQRKHTRYAHLDIPKLMMAAVGDMNGKLHGMDKRIQQYKEAEISDSLAHDTIIRALDARVICGQDVRHVLDQWRKPEHECFQPRTAWSLFNGFTAVLRDTNMAALPQRTRSLHGVIDAQIGLSA